MTSSSADRVQDEGKKRFPSGLKDYLICLGVVILATFLRKILDPLIEDKFPFITFFPAIVMVAWLGNLGASMLSVVLSLLAASWFVIPPHGTLGFHGMNDVVSKLLFLFLGMGMVLGGQYVHAARKLAESKVRETKRNQQLLEMEVQRHRESVEILNESEAHKVAILNSALDCIVTMDEKGRIVDFNHAAERTFGYSHSQVVRKTVAETLVPPHLREAHERGLKRFLETGYGPLLGRRVEIVAQHADGRLLPVELAITPTQLPGKPPFFTAYLRDISEHKRSEELRQLLAAIVESSDDAIVGKDLNGRIVSWNKGAERMFGYTASEMIGKMIEGTLLSPDRPDEEAKILEHVRRGGTEHFETVRMRKDGKPIHIALTVSPIKDSAGNIIGISSISRDITDRKLAEEHIRNLNLSLEQRVEDRTVELVNANHDLESFTYSVSHDLRAPLRHIDGYAQILEQDYPDQLPPETLRIVRRIRQGTQNMGCLVDDLLNLSHIGKKELARERINLNTMVQSVISDLMSENSARAIDWQVEHLPSVDGDAGLVKQIFVNLLSNAVKYSRSRAKVVIEVGSSCQGDETIFYVKDNGVGFDMKYSDRLFGVFQRLHKAEEFEGTGVGLATVQRIIRKHGGRIWAEAEVGKGAAFYFTLQPRSRANPATPMPPASQV